MNKQSDQAILYSPENSLVFHRTYRRDPSGKRQALLVARKRPSDESARPEGVLFLDTIGPSHVLAHVMGRSRGSMNFFKGPKTKAHNLMVRRGWKATRSQWTQRDITTDFAFHLRPPSLLSDQWWSRSFAPRGLTAEILGKGVVPVVVHVHSLKKNLWRVCAYIGMAIDIIHSEGPIASFTHHIPSTSSLKDEVRTILHHITVAIGTSNLGAPLFPIPGSSNPWTPVPAVSMDTGKLPEPLTPVTPAPPTPPVPSTTADPAPPMEIKDDDFARFVQGVRQGAIRCYRIRFRSQDGFNVELKKGDL